MEVDFLPPSDRISPVDGRWCQLEVDIFILKVVDECL